MGDEPAPTPQPLPEWLTWSAITNSDGSEGYTIVSLPLTYYGPSIPLGPDWTYGGETSPAPTDEAPITPAPVPEPTTVTVTQDPFTTTVYITLPPITVTATAPLSSVSSPIPGTLNPSSASSPLPSTFNPPSSVSSFGSNTLTRPPAISSTSGSVRPTSGTMTAVLPAPPPGSLSNSGVITRQPYSTTRPSQTTSFTSDTAPESVSALPSVTGTARTYLGLAPDAFLGVILAIVLSVIIFLCCILCWIRHRRRRQRRQQEALPPPTTEQTSRLLAGDRDPTREDLAYPYANQEREYRRSQIAMMRARGELDDEWEDRLYSPSMRSASVRLPEDEVGTSYGIRERAFAAAGVYGYTPVPRGPPSAGTGRGSVGDSTQVPTITPANAGIGAAARSSPTPRKDTRSTEATNESSAIHMYAAGGRSRTGSNEVTDDLFYHQTSEGEAPSPVASSADLHFLQRLGSQGATGVAAIAAARAARRHVPSSKSGSADSNNNSNNNPSTEAPHTRNLEELPRAAIAYPESPVSDDQENSRLMPENEGGEPSVTVMSDTSPQYQSQSSRESGLSRWIHGSDRSTRGSQHTPILQRVLHRVMGNRLSTQPAFAIVPPSATEPDTEQYTPPSGNRVPSRDFDFGNGLLFPRPPVHTGYSSGANTAKDDMRRWGGLLPSRLSSGNTSGAPRDSANLSAQGSGVDSNAPSQIEGNQNATRALGAPIMANRDMMPQMKERAPTPGSSSFLGFGLRPPPSAFPSDRNTSVVSSNRSTVYYDARSTTSTPMGTLGDGRDRSPSPLTRYDSPPPQPVTALRNAQSAQSLQPSPFLPPGLFDHSDSEPMDALDSPPPMPMRDVRQARSLNTIFSVGTAETYDTAHSPLSLGRTFLQDERARVPPPGLDPAPRTTRSVPSDIAPSEAADADLGVGTFDSIGRTSSNWRRDHSIVEDILEDEPPMAASQWRVLSTNPRDDNGSRRDVHGQSGNLTTDYLNWRLTLGQSFSITPRDGESPRHSQLGDFIPPHEGPSYDSQGSRDSSNRTNVSHSRDIHSLRASEGGVSGTVGSNGSKGSTQTGSSHNRSVSEYGHLRHPGTASGTGGPPLSAFGPGPSRQPRGGGGGATDNTENISAPSPVKKSLWWDSPEITRARTPPSAPATSSMIPGIRLVGSGGNSAGTSGQGPVSAPVMPTRGWPSQGVPLDVTAADGRRSQSHSFIHRDSPASLRSYAPLHSHSPSGGGSARELHSRPETSASHSQDHSHSQHTHGTHGAETTMGTMTEATTEDDHALPEHDGQDMPLSDVEHILRVQRKEVGGEQKMEEEHGRGRIGGGVVPPSPEMWTPRWQQL